MVTGAGEGRTADPVPLAEYDYPLPAELIAQEPADERDAARLMVVERATGRIRHHVVRELPGLLRAGDLLVCNDTRVRPARLCGHGRGGGAVELLLVRENRAQVWECLGKPVRRLRSGACIAFPQGGEGHVREVLGNGRYRIEFGGRLPLDALLATHGEMPLPPYIRRPGGSLPADARRYQTVFAEHDGAVAAPTAGLHFTTTLLDALARAGVEVARLTLHVGPGTFVPVRCEDARDHRMEEEDVVIPERTAAAVASARREGRRVVAVGTTTTRALESAAARWGEVRAGAFAADAFLLPGSRLRVVDALLTNFHLPRSTLLLLVSAFLGPSLLHRAYALAVRQRYRFYSYGDAMLVC